KGLYAREDENLIQNWYGYGVNVLAVSDGVVTSTRDDFLESKTLSEHPAYSPDKASGNYISIDIGNDNFAFYEHLKPNSIKVQVGHRLQQGARIACVGSTGRTTGPQLHFHGASRSSPIAAGGIPFAFESCKVLGICTDFEKFGKELLPANT